MTGQAVRPSYKNVDEGMRVDGDTKIYREKLSKDI
jgi:hypothetical protein